MRFVVGLCFGSLLVLAAAALLDWPGTPSKPLANVRAGLDSTKQMAEEPALPDPAPFAEQTPIDTAAPDLEPVESDSATAWPSLADSSTAVPEVPDNPMAPTTAPVSEQSDVVTPEPVAAPGDWMADEFSNAASSSVPTVEPDSADLATEATATVMPKAELGAATEDYPTSEGLPQVAVWRPFHSQMSAEGFAKRLSLQLGYPFSVVKVGAARYHVVFSYEDAAERDLLAEQLTALTGYSPK